MRKDMSNIIHVGSVVKKDDTYAIVAELINERYCLIDTGSGIEIWLDTYGEDQREFELWECSPMCTAKGEFFKKLKEDGWEPVKPENKKNFIRSK